MMKNAFCSHNRLVAALFVVLAGLIALPWLAAPREPAGRWFLSPLGRRTSMFSLIVAVVITPVLVVVSERAGRGATGWFAGGLIPLLVVAGAVVLLDLVLRRALGVPRLFAFTYVPGFFRKLGFHEETVLPDYVRDLEGHKQDMILMRCDLQALWSELEDFISTWDWQRTR